MQKTVVCYGDSNTWGCDPAPTHNRFPRNVRWTGVLQDLLGDRYYVIEEGCCGRTTVWDDPVEVDKNGKTYLGPLPRVTPASGSGGIDAGNQRPQTTLLCPGI